MRTALPAVALLATALIGGCGDDSTTEPSRTTAQPTESASASATPTGDPSRAETPAAAAEPSPGGTALAVSFAGGQLSGDTGRTKVKAGESVTIKVTSDVADEVHLHGYDLSLPVAAGGTVTLAFDATIPGVFELELEQLGKQLLSLQVQ